MALGVGVEDVEDWACELLSSSVLYRYCLAFL